MIIKKRKISLYVSENDIPSDIYAKSTLLHLTQFRLLSQLLLLQLSEESLQFLGSLGDYHRLCVSCIIHSNIICCKVNIFKQLRKTIKQKSYYHLLNTLT